MDTKLRTSFVPKKTLLAREDSRGPASINLFMSIGLIIFFMTLATGAGVYLYKTYVEKQIVDQGVKLQQAQQAFEPSLVSDVKLLDQKLIAAKTLLSSHIASSRIFDMLSVDTLQNVRFTNFKYSFDKVTGVTIAMDGETQDYSSIALQSDAFAEETQIKSADFSGFNPNDKGGVKFAVTAVVDPSSILYKADVNVVAPAL